MNLYNAFMQQKKVKQSQQQVTPSIASPMQFTGKAPACTEQAPIPTPRRLAFNTPVNTPAKKPIVKHWVPPVLPPVEEPAVEEPVAMPSWMRLEAESKAAEELLLHAREQCDLLLTSGRFKGYAQGLLQMLLSLLSHCLENSNGVFAYSGAQIRDELFVNQSLTWGKIIGKLVLNTEQYWTLEAERETLKSDMHLEFLLKVLYAASVPPEEVAHAPKRTAQSPEPTQADGIRQRKVRQKTD